ncbi:MAG: beta-galactosidase, partial [Armatimonadetes bacterium]|nr:beta-galactosidase [Armatimonadota bacterium]
MTRALLVLLTLTAALAAPPPPAGDVFLEGESSADHNFTTVGRDPAFAPCYGSAILQLQTTNPAPAGGYHATWRPTVAQAGWYEVLLAATRPEAAAAGLSPFSVQVGECRPRDLAGYAVTQRYGPGEIFGWVSAGRYQLPAGATAITVRCDTRRASDQAYLCYVDALALRRVDAPVATASWLAGGELSAAFGLTRRPVLPQLAVLCDGAFTARLNGQQVASGSGTARWTIADVRERLVVGRNTLSVSAAGPVLVKLAEFRGGQPSNLLLASGAAWRAGDGPAKVLGPETMAPYGDCGGLPMVTARVGRTTIPFKVGNLSVDLLMAEARGQKRPEPGPQTQFDAWHEQAGISVVEDYQCWLPLEPVRDQYRWEFYENNAAELEKRGMKYAIYPWLHFAPAWARESELWEPLVNLADGKTTFAPSIWSPKTEALFDRYYRALHARMGDRVKEIYVAMVTDYGEVGYPIGMADWVVPAPYKGPGWWCGDAMARADFARKMTAQAGDLARLNQRWGTQWTAAEQITYPAETATDGPAFDVLAKLPPAERAQARRRWLDFSAWYLDSMADFAGRAVGISRRYYPNTPHEIKIGFGSEKLRNGADYSEYVARSKADRYTVRSTHGKLPPYFYRRFSTAAKHYGTPLVTEPPSEVSRDEEVERIFKDASSGTTEYFDYPANYLGATDLFARYGGYMEGRHSLTEVAYFLPTTDHRLRPGQDNPKHLLDACGASRDLFDWDLLDERLVRAGFLRGYRALLMPEGNVIEADVLERLRAWVEAGGWLIAADRGPVETVEGQSADDLFADRAAAPRWQDAMAAQGTPLPACRVDIGAEGDEPLLVGDWGFAESGHWEWGGEPNVIRKRWTGARAGVLLPVDPTRSYELAIAVALHPKRFAQAGSVLVNGQKVGDIEPTRSSVFRATLSPALLAGRRVAEVTVTTAPWRPSEVDGSTDSRTLGLAVRWFKLWQAGQPEPDTAPRPVLARHLDRATLAACVRRLGRGGTLRLPADLPNASAFAEAAAALLSQAKPLPEPVLPRFDSARDGVWVALMANRVLLYNSAREPRTRQVELDPAVLRRLGAAAPERAATVTV